jgi:four helix bundle protein
MPKERRNPKLETEACYKPPLRLPSYPAWDDDGSSPMLLHDEESITALPKRDLMERTAQFGEAILRFAKKIPRSPENIRLIGQLVGAATSVGANYCEADDASSAKDYKNKVCTCRKESKETMFFLRMVAASEETLKDEARRLWREAKELNLIFGSIWRKL